ncbi:MAG: hypothetical protein OEU36_00360 [Gammaproteobacteria bacterium]|nr:hypothetical protein [Gammaproteobacteria bacterium]
MTAIKRLRFLLRLTSSQEIARRYFVTNGFDGALTMLGLMLGFHLSGTVALRVVISACLGAAIALAMSGLTSAYVSETAERKKALKELENAMVTDLGETAHGAAARLIPWLIALVNGMAPFLIALIIITPIWFSAFTDVELPLDPIQCSIGIAFIVIFLLGVFLGRIGGEFWLKSGGRMVLIALITVLLIYAFGR